MVHLEPQTYQTLQILVDEQTPSPSKNYYQLQYLLFKNLDVLCQFKMAIDIIRAKNML